MSIDFDFFTSYWLQTNLVTFFWNCLSLHSSCIASTVLTTHNCYCGTQINAIIPSLPLHPLVNAKTKQSKKKKKKEKKRNNNKKKKKHWNMTCLHENGLKPCVMIWCPTQTPIHLDKKLRKPDTGYRKQLHRNTVHSCGLKLVSHILEPHKLLYYKVPFVIFSVKIKIRGKKCPNSSLFSWSL